MKKYITLILLCAAVFAGCAKDEASCPAQADAPEDGVLVQFGLTTDGIQTGSNLEPMTRSHNDAYFKSAFRATSDVIIMKKMTDQLWVVDTMFTHNMVGGGLYSATGVTENTEFLPFSLVLRPGEYKALLIVNGRSAKINPNIKQAMHVYVDNVPLAVGYANVTAGNAWGGEICSGLEVFVGVKDFTVHKQQELVTPGVSVPVAIHATRRTTKFELWPKYVEGAEKNFDHILGYQLGFSMIALDGDEFCAGVDMFGNPYYSSLTEIGTVTWSKALSTDPTEGPSSYYFKTIDGTELYAMSHVGTTCYSVWFFSDPDRDVRFRVDRIKIAFRQGDAEYHGVETAEGTLSHGVNTAFGLVPNGVRPPSMNQNERRYVKFERDDSGNVPNIIDKMDPYVSWNFPFLGLD